MEAIKSGHAHRWAFSALDRCAGDHDKAIEFCHEMAENQNLDLRSRQMWLGAAKWVESKRNWDRK